MPLRKFMERLTKPVEEHDREKLQEYCERLDVTPLDEVEPRKRVKVAGEVQVVRIVPRAGSPSLEVTISDGQGQATAIFFGRRRIAGIAHGRRLILEGVLAEKDRRRLIHNPTYRLLP